MSIRIFDNDKKYFFIDWWNRIIYFSAFVPGKKHQSLWDLKNQQGKLKDFFGESSVGKEKEPIPKINDVSHETLSSYVSKNDVLDAEIKWSLKTVNNHYSFNSCEGVSSLFKDMFPDSNIAKQFTCGPTKCAYIVNFGIAPHFKASLFKCLDEAEEYCILFDESLNHTTELKQMDIHARFWNNEDNIIITRYVDSLFLGHSTASDIVSAIQEATKNLSFSKVINLSMDGPAVNWKVFTILQNEVEKKFNTKFVNVGSCGLHSLHNAFKNASNSISWDIDGFLLSLYWLFKDAPARREDFLAISQSKKMPKHFCMHRWLENAPAAERALEIFDDLKEYIKFVEKGKSKKPTCKSFRIIANCCKDILLPVKLNFFLSVAKIFEPFLKMYQSDYPLLPFLAEDILRLATDCLIMCNILKKEKLNSLTTPYKLAIFDFTEKCSLTDLSEVCFGFVGDKILKEVKKDRNLPEKQLMELRHDCQTFILSLVTSICKKTPIQFAFVRLLSCLDPRKMATRSHDCYRRMKRLVTILVDINKVEKQICDALLLEYQSFLNEIMSNSTEFEFYDVFNSRLDTFFYKHLNGKAKYQNLWTVIKKVLIISHGQGTVERGFSVNKQIEVENLQEMSFIAKRIINDEIRCSGGLNGIKITKELRTSVFLARQRYLTYLDEQKKKKQADMESRKRKNIFDDLNYFKTKKSHLEQSVNELQESADKLAEKAEATGNMQLIVQSNSFRRTAKEKMEKIKQIECDIAKIVNELKN